MVFILRVDAVPIRRLPGKKFALSFEDVQRSANLGAGVRGIEVIKNIFEYRHLLGAVGIFSGVVLVIHRDEAHAHPREICSR